MLSRLVAVVAMLGCVALSSCGPGVEASDCNVRFSLNGDIYRPASGLQTPHRGERIGTATTVGCDGKTSPKGRKVKLYEVVGHQPEEVVFLGRRSLYIKETISWRARPQLIKNSERYLTCSGAGARFTGLWRYVEPEDMPNLEDYGSARVPYTAVFSTRQGTGVGLDRWAHVTLQAEVTRDTRPLPTPRFLKRATSGNEPVTVTATCRDQAFQVATMRFAQ